jgi:hypothetical protein
VSQIIGIVIHVSLTYQFRNEAAKVGATVRPMLGILLGLKVGPEEGLGEPVGKSEMTKVAATVGPMLGILLEL